MRLVSGSHTLRREEIDRLKSCSRFSNVLHEEQQRTCGSALVFLGRTPCMSLCLGQGGGGWVEVEGGGWTAVNGPM